MNNLVFLAAIHSPANNESQSLSLKSWKHWCNRNKVDLFVLDQHFEGPAKLPPRWQRLHALRVLEKHNIDYHQVAIVDTSTVAHPACPNFFKETNNCLGVVADWYIPKLVTINLNFLKFAFPNISLTWDEYFDDCVLIANASHKALLEKIFKTLCHLAQTKEIHRSITGSSLVESALINYSAKQDNIKLTQLDQCYNICHPERRYALTENSYKYLHGIWNFRSFEDSKIDIEMKKFWAGCTTEEEKTA